MTDESGRNDGGLHRRDLIKKAAIAGGVAWAAPMVFTSSASASQGCPTGSCPNYHVVKLDSQGPHASPTNPGPGVACPGHFIDLVSAGNPKTVGGQCPFPALPAGATLVNTSCANFNSHVQTITDTGSGDNITTTITLEPGFQWVIGFSKKGKPIGGQQCPGEDGGEGTISNSCRTIVIPPHSHIELMYCGPS